MTDLRKLARDRECMIRLPGCDGGGETTVLAHFRMIGVSGIGMKSPDLIASWACHRCHDLADGRAHMANLTRDEVRLAHAEGCFRTIAKLVKEGVITSG